MRTTTVVRVLRLMGQLRAAIPTELLLRLMNATPEQYAAVERILFSADDACPPFALREELGNWTLVFEGRTAVLRDCRAMRLVAQLLKNPPDVPIHATEWESRVDGRPLADGAGELGQAEEDGRPGSEDRDVGGVIQERSGKKFMGGISLPALRAKLAELRAASEDAALPEHERSEAREEFLNLLRAHGRGGKFAGEAERAVDRVRKQVRALIRELQSAGGDVLRDFGRHLEDRLWLPSVGGRKRIGAAGKAGCFTYEPPSGVRWCD